MKQTPDSRCKLGLSMSLAFRTMATLALALLAGCPADLGRFHLSDAASDAVPGDVGTPADSSTDAGPDGAVPGSCELAPTCTAGCPLPWLLASVEDLPGDEDCGGQVVRMSISDRETFCVCPTLRAEGTMPSLPFAVGFVPPSTVVVASEEDRALAIDGETDRVLWDEPFGGQPADIFPIEAPSGELQVVVASKVRGGDIRSLYFYDAASGGAADVSTTTELGMGLGIPSVTVSPRDRHFLRALKTNGGYAAADVDPWGMVVFNSPPHTADRSGFFLRSISSFFYGGTYRVAWTGRRTDLSPELHQVYNYRSSTPADDGRVPLGAVCREGEDRLDFGVECDFLHAVPHPFHDTDQFALCGYTGGRMIVRIRTIDSVCHIMARQRDVFTSARFSRLGLALDDYWDPT